MQTTKQISVSLVNKPGRLADMLNALSKEKVGFQALSVMDSGERGTVRFVPDNFEAAVGVLQSMNVNYDAADVLLVEMPSQAGVFRKICEKLAGEHLNIDYAYCSFASGKGSRGVLAVVAGERPCQGPARARRGFGRGIEDPPQARAEAGLRAVDE